jgi:hypothetical protein
MNLSELCKYPIYRSPDGIARVCIGWAAQDILDVQPEKVITTEWYIFSEEKVGDEVLYYGAICSAEGTKLGQFRKSDLMQIPKMFTEERAESLRELDPPPNWKRVG